MPPRSATSESDVSLGITTHDADHVEQLAYWRSLSPNERVELTVELSRRMRQLESDNGRTPEGLPAFSQRRRR